MFRYVLIAWGEIIYNRTSFATCDFDPRPTTWATKFKCVRANKVLISIRAPPQGATYTFADLYVNPSVFNPRPAARGRLGETWNMLTTGLFSIRTPPQGATVKPQNSFCLFCFQSTPHHKGGDRNILSTYRSTSNICQSTLSLSALSHKTTTIIPRYQRERSGILCALPFRTGKSTLLL